MTTSLRARWAAVGAAIAVTLGAGGFGLANAALDSGERPVFVAITPCRILDTRAGSAVITKQTPLGPGDIHTQSTHGNNGLCTNIPTDATALALNATAIGATTPGTYITIWPTGAPQPDASSLNPAPGQPPTPNAVITDISPGGQFDIYNYTGTVDLLIDVTGYYVDHNHDDRYYTKGEVDTAIGGGGGPIDVYTKAETDAALDLLDTAIGTKADITNVYTKAQVDARTPTLLSVSPAAFSPRDPDLTTHAVGSGGQLAVVTGTRDVMLAPLSLPHGATITSIRAVVQDNRPDALISVSVMRVKATNPTYETIFSASSARPYSQAADLTLSDFTPSSAQRAVVDNSNYSYLAEINVPDNNWSSFTWDIRFHHLLITYTLP